MRLGAFAKEPAEVFPIGVNYTNDLEAGETIVTPTVTARDAVTSADTTGTVFIGGALVSGPVVKRTVQAGADGERHILQYTVTTSNGNRFEHTVQMSIKET